MVALQARHADMTGLLTEQLFAAPAVHAFDAADYERSRFAAVASGYTRAGRATLRVGAGTRGFVNFLSIVAIVFVLICGLQGVDLDKKGDLNALVKFALFVALLGEPLTRISRTVFEIQRALAAGARIFEIIDSPIDAQDGRQVFPDSAQGAVRFENVSFSYHPDEPILRAISLELQPRENVAIVGASGCGKSTLAGLILRFIDPTQGKVTIDGVNSRDVKLADLRARVGWMGQEAFLVSGTVYDNIRYGKRSANPTELEQAARMVAADEFIRELPLGYESRLGERGVNLSGGQRARIAMARAVVRNPAIAIFDESTAALDTDTEMLLWRRLRPWMTERTTIIIAHRLLTILEVPRIIVLDGGKIVGDGSAQQLQKTCPTFQRLFAEQMNLMSQAA
jgi:subfamily B ATP-binding cassette protein MsbA